jgi:hypothetical protein
MMSWRNLATDPKDQIYGKWGFMKIQYLLAIEPDYNIDTAEMYASVSGRIMLHERSLDLLTSAGIGYPSSLRGFPCGRRITSLMVTMHQEQQKRKSRLTKQPS